MKMKVSGEWTEQNNGGNAHHIYAIRGFERYLLSAVFSPVADVLFFVLFLHWLFENKRQKQWKWSLADNERNKRTTETPIVNRPSESLNGTYPLLLLLLLLLFSFLCYCCVYFLEICTKRQWNWILANNEWNKRTAEILIVNTPSRDQTVLALCYFCSCYSIFCAVAVDIVSTKKRTPNSLTHN